MGQDQSEVVSKAEKRDYSLIELASFDGQKPEKPTLVCISNKIYDVSSSPMYKPDGGYHTYAGKDITKALAKGMREILPNEYEIQSFDVSTLNAEEQETLLKWEQFFQRKYPIIGKLAPNTNSNL